MPEQMTPKIDAINYKTKRKNALQTSDAKQVDFNIDEVKDLAKPQNYQIAYDGASIDDYKITNDIIAIEKKEPPDIKKRYSDLSFGWDATDNSISKSEAGKKLEEKNLLQRLEGLGNLKKEKILLNVRL